MKSVTKSTGAAAPGTRPPGAQASLENTAPEEYPGRTVANFALQLLLAELPARNRDNVARTESYLELYGYTVDHPPDLPWLLMAHLVSRSAGYLMTAAAEALEAPRWPVPREAVLEYFYFLERANFLIFQDAWHHVLLHLLGRVEQMRPGRVPAFMQQAWRRYQAATCDAAAATPQVERGLVLDLVTNEQNYIERRVVHNPRYARALELVTLAEQGGQEGAVYLPGSAARIRVGGFADLRRRIEAGRRIFDDVLVHRVERRRLFEWAQEHPHTGSRADHGGRPSRALREAWPVSTVLQQRPDLHDPPEPDPNWP